MIPQWTAGTHRIVYNARLLAPALPMPPYAAGETWAIDSWWSRGAAKAD